MRRSVVAEQSLKGLTDVKWGVGGGRKAPGAPAVCTYLLTTVRTGRSKGGKETCTIEKMTGEVEEGEGGGESRLERRIKISEGEGGREEKRNTHTPSAPSSFDTFET